MFILIVESNEARSGVKGNPVLTKKGDRFLVENENEGWVEATSSRWREKINKGAKLFETAAEAESFAHRWQGHPWWCRPNGNYEVINVKPVFEKITVGYERAKKVK